MAGHHTNNTKLRHKNEALKAKQKFDNESKEKRYKRVPILRGFKLVEIKEGEEE